MKGPSYLKKILTSPDCPFWLFQLPLFPYYVYLFIKSRSATFFTACNPDLLTGGLVNEHKYELLNQVPIPFRPLTVFIEKEESALMILTKMNEAGMDFPVILKPNIGEKGWRVKKVNSANELLDYLRNNRYDFLIQEFIEYSVELGVLFYQIPDSGDFGITSIGIKELPSVIGNGIDRLSKLAEHNSRFIELLNENRLNADKVFPLGQRVNLDYIAHRNRGTVFKDASHLISPQVIECFRKITEGIKGFYFGRYDIKVKTLEGFSVNPECMIMEVNGVGSVPIHIFDPSISTIQMYKAMYRHWELIYRISMINHTKGIDFMSWKAFKQEVRKNKEQLRHSL